MNLKLGLLLLIPSFALVLVLRGGDTYPHAELLMEPAQLAKRDTLRHCVVLDVRERASYEQGHVPSARWVDRTAWSAEFGHGEDAARWSKRIGDLGIGPESRVVVYDDNFSKDAAHVWWMLRYWGVDDVRLLNGGWTGWTAGGHPTDRRKPGGEPVPFVARGRTERLAIKEQLLCALNGTNLQILDARTADEYCGNQKLHNQRAGAIPGAKHLEWIELVDRQTHRFRAPIDLRRSFAAAGITLDMPTTVYCQSGVRSAVLAFAMELMGARDVHNYHAGWAEWSAAADMPVVPGKGRR
jgi:thiosulfate/3-mercaptopyruvate sulfurtransferase